MNTAPKRKPAANPSTGSRPASCCRRAEAITGLAPLRQGRPCRPALAARPNFGHKKTASRTVCLLNLERETRLELARLPAQQLPAQPDLGKVALYQLSHSFCARISGTKKPSHGRFFAESGAGNGTSTDALSVCFPTLFFAEGLNEGLNFSLVFGRRQRRPSTNFHSPPTPSAHLRATPCRGSPLHRVRVRELSAHLSALHS